MAVNVGQGKYKLQASGRKRPPQEFLYASGGERERHEGFSKKGRFQDEGDGGIAIPPATLRILIRNQDAGGIIGKGGENIKRLRKKHDCQVVLPDSPGAPERVMTMMGTIEGCVGVLSDCLPKLGEGVFKEGKEGPHGDNPEDTHEVQVLIPQPFMGTIIGTGGTKIKELRTRTHASVKIFSDPMPNSNERSAQIVGSEKQITDCVQYFLEEISKKEPRDPIFLYDPSAGVGMFDAPPPPAADFPVPRNRGGPPFEGSSFRGGRDRDGGRQTFDEDDWSPNRRGSGRREGRGGGGNGDGARVERGGSSYSGWRDNGQQQSGRDRRSHTIDSQRSAFQPRPPAPTQQIHRPPLIDPQLTSQAHTPSMYGHSVSNIGPTGGPSLPTLLPSSSQAAGLLSQATATQYPGQLPSLVQSNTAAAQPLVGSGYNPSSQVSGEPGGYGGGQSGVGYSSLSQPHTSIPTAVPTQLTQLGQAPGGVPQMYLPPAAHSINQPPHSLMPPQPPAAGQVTQQVTIPGEYVMSILGPSGSNLSQIKAQSSCDIIINDSKPGANEKIITITGLPSNIQLAQSLMQNSVRQFHSV